MKRVEAPKTRRPVGALRGANAPRPHLVRLDASSQRVADVTEKLLAATLESNALQREQIKATKAATAETERHRQVMERIAAALEARPLA
jgi:hypothetical protein